MEVQQFMDLYEILAQAPVALEQILDLADETVADEASKPIRKCRIIIPGQ